MKITNFYITVVLLVLSLHAPLRAQNDDAPPKNIWEYKPDAVLSDVELRRWAEKFVPRNRAQSIWLLEFQLVKLNRLLAQRRQDEKDWEILIEMDKESSKKKKERINQLDQEIRALQEKDEQLLEQLKKLDQEIQTPSLKRSLN